MTMPDQWPGQVFRHVTRQVSEAMSAFRVVIVNGPRQAGKSTLLRELHRETGGELHNLDIEALLQAAHADPAAFVRGTESFVYIDEVQRGGDALVRAIKEIVDDPGNRTKFVLAGSANFLTVPSLAESLAGRAVLVEVWPFSQGERDGSTDGFLDRLTEAPTSLRDGPYERMGRADYFERIVTGGFPEPAQLPTSRLRRAWFNSYVETITQRDIRELSRVRQAAELPRLLRYLAGETGHELIKSKLAAAVGLDRSTVANYLPLFETVFLVRELPAWSRNPLGKVTRTPKVHICDTGLVAALHGIGAPALDQPVAAMRGQLTETFVHNEIVKQRTWCAAEVELFHWRDREGAEVDLIVQASDGSVFGIEVKSSSTVNMADFRWLRRLEDRLPGEFRHGIVFYLGDRALSFGSTMTALPLAALWA